MATTKDMGIAIEGDRFYTITEVGKLMGWGASMKARAIRNGLQYHLHGRQRLIKGSELIRYLSSLDKKGKQVERAGA